MPYLPPGAKNERIPLCLVFLSLQSQVCLRSLMWLGCYDKIRDCNDLAALTDLERGIQETKEKFDCR